MWLAKEMMFLILYPGLTASVISFFPLLSLWKYPPEEAILIDMFPAVVPLCKGLSLLS